MDQFGSQMFLYGSDIEYGEIEVYFFGKQVITTWKSSGHLRENHKFNIPKIEVSEYKNSKHFLSHCDKGRAFLFKNTGYKSGKLDIYSQESVIARFTVKEG